MPTWDGSLSRKNLAITWGDSGRTVSLVARMLVQIQPIPPDLYTKCRYGEMVDTTHLKCVVPKGRVGSSPASGT